MSTENSGWSIQVFGDGIYFSSKNLLEGGYAKDDRPIQFFSFTSDEISAVAPHVRSARNMAVSPDRKQILYEQWEPKTADFMLVGTFR